MTTIENIKNSEEANPSSRKLYQGSEQESATYSRTPSLETATIICHEISCFFLLYQPLILAQRNHERPRIRQIIGMKLADSSFDPCIYYDYFCIFL